MCHHVGAVAGLGLDQLGHRQVIRSPLQGRTNVTGKTPGWNGALNALAMHYGDRITHRLSDTPEGSARRQNRMRVCPSIRN